MLHGHPSQIFCAKFAVRSALLRHVSQIFKQIEGLKAAEELVVPQTSEGKSRACGTADLSGKEPRIIEPQTSSQGDPEDSQRQG